MYEIIIFFIFADGGKDTFNFANGFSKKTDCEQYIEKNQIEIDKIIDSIVDDDERVAKPFCYPQRKTVSI